MHWIHTIKKQGWANTALSILDMIEPIAPLLGQSLWVAQPFARAFNAQTAIHELALYLETPDGLQALREELKGATPS